jgi:ammonium transporter, Amt family
VGGVIGSILLGVFASAEINGITGGTKQLLIQLAGVSIVIVYTIIVCWIIFKITDLTGTLRVPDDVQEKGLDQAYLEEVED